MNESQSSVDEDAWLRDTLYYIRMCFLPIVVVGTISNILNFVILTRRDMRCLSTTVYLFALSVADLGVMYIELLRVWFEWMDLVKPEVYFTDTYCKIANFSNGVVRDYSNWLVACLTLERVLMVARPHTARLYSTVSNARKVVACLLVAICVPHSHCLFFSVAQHHTWWVCWEDPSIPAASLLAALVEFGVGYTVVIVVLVLDLLLALLICDSDALTCLTKCIKAAHRPEVAATRLRSLRQRRLTRTLLVIAVVFVVCETPRIILSFLCRFRQRTPLRRISLNVAYAISGINHACNFFIYILSSPRFRQMLLQTLSKVSKQKHDRPVTETKPRVSSLDVAENNTLVCYASGKLVRRNNLCPGEEQLNGVECDNGSTSHDGELTVNL